LTDTIDVNNSGETISSFPDPTDREVSFHIHYLRNYFKSADHDAFLTLESGNLEKIRGFVAAHILMEQIDNSLNPDDYMSATIDGETDITSRPELVRLMVRRDATLGHLMIDGDDIVHFAHEMHRSHGKNENNLHFTSGFMAYFDFYLKTDAKAE
jgi:hypothetical protein